MDKLQSIEEKYSPWFITEDERKNLRAALQEAHSLGKEQWIPLDGTFDMPEPGTLCDTFSPTEGFRYISYGSVGTGFPVGVTHYRIPTPPKQ